ncbi:tetratricopeptide repeat protein [Lentzea terrae]|uniref:tetratricopeptide repeat protein n=1 Tax=Lentzea terrae TaxID=2200761 RepID=UPI000DD4E75D|nr:tetratricopeptide repeat protein [Lentzea terrae]
MAVELPKLAEGTLRTLTGMPGTSDVVSHDLVHHVVGDPILGAAIIAEWTQAGQASQVDEHHIKLTTIMQPASESLPAYRLVIGWYATRATMADKATQPHSFRISPAYAKPGQLYESAEHAKTWFYEHLRGLTAMLNAAHDHGWHDLVLQLAEPLWSLHRLTGDHENELATQTLALAAAEHLPEDHQARTLAVCHSRAAYALSSLQRHTEAFQASELALEYAWAADEPRILSAALSICGRAHQFAKQPHAAMKYYRQALALAEQLEDPRSLALRHRRIGEVLVELDDPSGAISHHEKAAELMKTADDTVGHARVITFLGRALLTGEQPASTYAAVYPALKILATSGSDYWQADANEVLGQASEHADPTGSAALRFYTEAIDKFESGGEPMHADRVRARVAALTPQLPQ